MNGKDLRLAIKGKVSVNDLLERTGIKRTTFYTFYDKNVDVPNECLEKIEQAGINLDIPEQNSDILSNPVYLKNQILLKDKMIDILESNNETLRSVINSGIDHGYQFLKPKEEKKENVKKVESVSF